MRELRVKAFTVDGHDATSTISIIIPDDMEIERERPPHAWEGTSFRGHPIKHYEATPEAIEFVANAIAAEFRRFAAAEALSAIQWL